MSGHYEALFLVQGLFLSFLTPQTLVYRSEEEREERKETEIIRVIIIKTITVLIYSNCAMCITLCWRIHIHYVN